MTEGQVHAFQCLSRNAIDLAGLARAEAVLAGHQTDRSSQGLVFIVALLIAGRGFRQGGGRDRLLPGGTGSGQADFGFRLGLAARVHDTPTDLHGALQLHQQLFSGQLGQIEGQRGAQDRALAAGQQLPGTADEVLDDEGRVSLLDTGIRGVGIEGQEVPGHHPAHDYLGFCGQ